MRADSPKTLERLRESYKNALSLQKKKILVCAGTGCVAGGSLKIYEQFKKLAEKYSHLAEVKLETEKEGIGVKKSGCHGYCEMGPLVRIEPSGYLYLKVQLGDCDEIFEKTILNDEPVIRLMSKNGNEVVMSQEDIPFYKKQTRMVLENCGHIDADSIEEYIAKDGYSSLVKAIKLGQDEVIRIISDSNLRGRGGGGFPAGRKWAQVKRQKETVRYVVCNGDEGDPGAFMDRSILEGDPHKLIEGMMIAAYATGCKEGYIYVRAEYPLAVERLKKAVADAKKFGLIGDNILNSGFHFDLHINQGAGAFVCGEGSALTASIEGDRGMPRVKPPRTVEQGLWGKPTVLNNVETFANVPIIIRNGDEWYRNIGPENSPGTKAFALTGNVNNTGLIEVPMGTTLREVIFDIGGGVKNGKEFKAVQIGGPSGGCLTKDHLDIPLDFDSLKKLGAMIGSGGLVVMDSDTCMVEVARFFMNFTQNESCGKCVPCREGTKRMLEILERIVAGKGTEEDLETLEELADTISKTALCGLGKSAANPVVSTLKYFRNEYIDHVVHKRCKPGICQALRRIVIDAEKCKGCSKCSRICPVSAITGKVKEPFEINQEKCIKCGACIESCAFKAIREE